MEKALIPEKWRHYRPETIAVLASRGFHDWREDPFHSVLPPEQGLSGSIYTSIVYGFTDAKEAADIFTGKEGYAYPRIACGTPPIHELSQKILELELGDYFHSLKEEYDVLLTASGMSAVAMTVLTLADRNRTIISSPYLYGGTYHLFDEFLPRLGISCVMVNDPLDFKDWEESILGADAPTCLFAEDDANPMLIQLNNEELATIAHLHGLLYICDTTVGTPTLKKPLAVKDPSRRADVVIHSLSKNISGHSWGLGGAIIGKKKIVQQIRDSYFVVFGPIMDPRVADKILVGLKTLKERITRKLHNARHVAAFLKMHTLVKKVYGPSADLLSFEIKGNLDDARRFVEALRLIIFAPHLGDIRTLAIHPASTTHAKVPAAERLKMGITDTLIRLSIGLEHRDDIIGDLARAFDVLERDKL